MPPPTFSCSAKCISILSFLILFLTELTVADQASNTTIGAIIDVSSRRGKEEKVSIEIAIQAYAVSTSGLNLVLQVIDSGGKSLQASLAAEGFVAGKQVQTIIGLQTWQEAAWVTEIANQAQVPFLSLAAPSNTPSLASTRWPYLVRMTKNDSRQIQCLASIVSSYEWRRVIAIYEDDGSGMLPPLSDALQVVGSEVEHWLAFPPLPSLSDPKNFVTLELEKLKNTTQSRVFIILRSSLELATLIFPEANRLGLMGEDSVWITTDSLANLLDAVDSTVISSMQGVIGIKTYFNNSNPSFKDFSFLFRNLFRSTYPEEEKSEPGFYALRAYDTISTVALAAAKSVSNNDSSLTSSPSLLLESIIATDFNGLSGEIRFKDKELSPSSTYEIVNVVGKSYVTLKFWSSEYGFSDNFSGQNSRNKTKNRGGSSGKKKVLDGIVYWPGGLKRIPLGWVMPSDSKPFIVGIPGKTPFEKFVKRVDGEEPIGFCIELFKSVLGHLHYHLPYEFRVFNDSSYNNLVDQVYLKNFDAVVGDITILANRSDRVDFTQPYAESALTMVVPVKPQKSLWLIVKPFRPKLWMMVTGVLLYTTFTIWFFEDRPNPAYRGLWRMQVGSAIWCIGTTLFFVHRETFRSNHTRVVIFFWLITVFIVTSSYIASLTSMLTVTSLEPMFTDLETLRRDNSSVGIDKGSFLLAYLEEVLGFPAEKIISIPSEYDYPLAFENGTIKAAFLELPYTRIFLARNSTNYIDAGLRQRLGGFGFAFPKGSPMARDFSKAFLKLSEHGILSNMDRGWFGPPSTCPDNSISNQRLSLDSFWPLFVGLIVISTTMLILYTVENTTNNRYRSFGDFLRGIPADPPAGQAADQPVRQLDPLDNQPERRPNIHELAQI